MGYVQAIEGIRRVARNLAARDLDNLVSVMNGTSSDQFIERPTAGLLSLFRDGYQYGQVVVDHLTSAEPFYWSPDMCDMLEGLAGGIPDWTLRLTDLVSQYGFAWFSKPVDIGADMFLQGGKRARVPLAGYLWGMIRHVNDSSFGDGVVVSDAEVPEGAPTRWWVIYSPIAMLNGEPRYCGGSSWEVGESLSALMDASKDDKDDPEWPWMCAMGKCFATMMALMEQRIISAEHVPLSRTERKLLDREGWYGNRDVRVVKLRRVNPSGKPAEDGEKAYELTCQFVVRSHWRNQYYPSTNEHRPKLILPYIKGPEGAPMLPIRPRAFEVVR